MFVRMFASPAVGLALMAAGSGQAAATRPRPAPPVVEMPAHMDEYSYRDALGAVWGYQSCGARASAATYRALGARLHEIEEMARAKGLGPTLDRVREEYNRLLAVSTMMPCARGPIAGLAGARRALAAFDWWVVHTRR